MKNIVILLFLTILFGTIAFYNEKNMINVVIQFETLRPLFKKLDIFYNGYKIGHTKQIAPCYNSKSVCVYSVLNGSKMFLPDNLSAKLKIKKLHDDKHIEYIDLIYPANPSHNGLINDSTILGSISKGLNNYLIEEVDYSEIDEIKNSFLNTSKNLEESTFLLLDILNSLNSVVKNSENNLINSSSSLNSSLKSLDNLINQTKTNSNHILSNFDNFSSEFYNSFDIQANSYYLNSITKNANEIITGINCNLKKPFGFFRILFGRVSN